tara:strand:+ start:5243 stop:5722 length:480 start_codon:yes stop_codon:yes gene_type:complete
MKNILKPKKNIMTIIILSKVFRRKMNSIPEDVVEHIISFSCDKRGYNTIDYYQRIKNNEDRMKRILIELSDFFFYMKVKNRPFSLRSLRPSIYQKWKYKMFKENLKEGNPTILYHTGLFLNFEDEELAARYYNGVEEKYGLKLWLNKEEDVKWKTYQKI